MERLGAAKRDVPVVCGEEHGGAEALLHDARHYEARGCTVPAVCTCTVPWRSEETTASAEGIVAWRVGATLSVGKRVPLGRM